MIEIDLNIQHYFCGGVYAKRMTLPANHYSTTHKHNFDHMSILASGAVVVLTDGKSTSYVAGDCIDIKAGIEHTIVALEDAIWFCIHATDITDPEKIDETLIERG